MTIGEFWGHVTTLVVVFNGRVTSGPRSWSQNRAAGGVVNSYHVFGLAADVILGSREDKEAFSLAAARLGIRVIDEMKEKNHLHLQPL